MEKNEFRRLIAIIGTVKEAAELLESSPGWISNLQCGSDEIPKNFGRLVFATAKICLLEKENEALRAQGFDVEHRGPDHLEVEIIDLESNSLNPPRKKRVKTKYVKKVVEHGN